MLEFLKKLSDSVWNKPIYRHLLFFLLSILTVLFMGYYFGTFDQVIHIPFLKKTADPSLFPNDPFFDLKNYHYSFFWYFFIPFYRLKILEIVVFVIHVISTYLTFWSIWRLSKTLFNNPLSSLLSLIAFLLPHIGFASFIIFEFSLLNRTFVLPFLLFAIDFYLKGKYLLAFFILGLMYNLHVVSVNFVLAMIFGDIILRLKKISIKKIIYGFFIFLLTAFPVLFWKFSNSKVELGLNYEWFSIIYRGFMYHIFAIVTTNPLIAFLVIGGFSLFGSFYLTLKKSESKYNQIIVNFLLAAFIILIIEAIASLWFPATIIIQSQIIRVGGFVIIFTYLFAGNYLSRLILENKNKLSINLIFSGLLFSVTPISLFISLLAEKLCKKNKIKNFISVFIIIGGIIYLTATFIFNIWRPGIEIFPPRNDFNDVQLWAKNNTGKNSVFITPPQLWWFYNTNWRVLSERSTVVLLSDLLEVSFYPSYIDYWRGRFEDLAPGALTKFKGDYFDNVKITSRAYYSLNEKQMINVSKKYLADFLVVEKPHIYKFPILYQNWGFIVYDLRSFNR